MLIKSFQEDNKVINIDFYKRLNNLKNSIYLALDILRGVNIFYN